MKYTRNRIVCQTSGLECLICELSWKVYKYEDICIPFEPYLRHEMFYMPLQRGVLVNNYTGDRRETSKTAVCTSMQIEFLINVLLRVVN